MITVLAVTLALAAAPASGGPTQSSYQTTGGDLYSELDAHALAAGLSPLRPTDADELRIWGHSYMLREVAGYVITGDAIVTCSTQYEYASDVVTINPATCVNFSGWHGNSDVLGKLIELSQLDDAELECETYDGVGYLIEGVVAGRRFAFTANNPGNCSDDGSRLVSRVLQMLPGEQ